MRTALAGARLFQHCERRRMTRALAQLMITRAMASLALSIAMADVAAAAEIKVLSGSGVQPAMNELVPQFEQASGHKVMFDYGTVGGMRSGFAPARLPTCSSPR